MEIKRDGRRGSIYDTLYVAKAIREIQGGTRKPQIGSVNIYDASQPRDIHAAQSVSALMISEFVSKFK